MSAFKFSYQWDRSTLNRMLFAFKKAKDDPLMKMDPTLCYLAAKLIMQSLSILLRLASLKSDGAHQLKKKLICLLDKLMEKLKDESSPAPISMKLVQLYKSTLDKVHRVGGGSGATKHEALSDMMFGFNVNGYVKAVVVSAIVVKDWDSDLPSYFVLRESPNHTCFIFMFNAKEKLPIKKGDTVVLVRPIVRLVNFQRDGKNYHFKSVRVKEYHDVQLNGSYFPLDFSDRGLRVMMPATGVVADDEDVVCPASLMSTSKSEQSGGWLGFMFRKIEDWDQLRCDMLGNSSILAFSNSVDFGHVLERCMQHVLTRFKEESGESIGGAVHGGGVVEIPESSGSAGSGVISRIARSVSFGCSDVEW